MARGSAPPAPARMALAVRSLSFFDVSLPGMGCGVAAIPEELKIVGDIPPDMHYVMHTNTELPPKAVIRSFACRDTEHLYHRERGRRFRPIERPALRKLRMLDAATAMADLSGPPGNRLEKLKGDREGPWRERNT